jgi:hypothetical protein
MCQRIFATVDQEEFTKKSARPGARRPIPSHWLASGAGDGTVTIWDATPRPEKP